MIYEYFGGIILIKVDSFDDGNIVAYDNTIADSVLFEKMHFNFPKSWNGYAKTAVFRNGNTIISVVLNADNVLCTDENECYIPYEVIKAPYFTVSVFGVLGDSRATTAQAKINVRESGYGEGDVPSEPSPTEYEQLLSIATETKQIAQSVRDDADSGSFKGEKGDTGEKGDKGEPFTFDDFTSEQLESLKGEKGDKGDKGDKGEKGDAFTYEDFTDEQLASLKGEKGDVGEVSLEYANNTFSGALKVTKTGKALFIGDVAAVEHKISLKLSSESITDLTTVTVSRYGKNLFDKSISFDDYNIYQGGYRYIAIYVGIGTTVTVSVLKKYNPGERSGYFYCTAFKREEGEIFPESNTKWIYSNTVAGLCNKSQTMVSENGYISLFMTSSSYNAFKDEILVEIGSNATEYELYIQPQIIQSDSEGTVSGLKSVSPNMTILADTDEVVLNCTYNADTKLYIDNKIAELTK